MKAQWHHIHTDDARATDTATCPSSMEIVTDGNFPYTSADEAKPIAGSVPKAKPAVKKEEPPPESSAVSAGSVGVAEVEASGAETSAKVTDKEKQDVNQAVHEERASGHALGAGEQPSAAGTLDSVKSSVSPTQSMLDEVFGPDSPEVRERHFNQLKDMVKSLGELKDKLDKMKTPVPTPAASPRNVATADTFEVDYTSDGDGDSPADEQAADAVDQTEISQEAVNGALASFWFLIFSCRVRLVLTLKVYLNEWSASYFLMI